MRFTVVWTQFALGQLANLWRQASDRHAVSDAADKVDPILRDDPDTKGIPLGRFCILEIVSLAFLYEVTPPDRLVRVLSVRRTP